MHSFLERNSIAEVFILDVGLEIVSLAPSLTSLGLSMGVNIRHLKNLAVLGMIGEDCHDDKHANKSKGASRILQEKVVAATFNRVQRVRHDQVS